MGVARPDLRLNLRIFPLWRRVVIAYEIADNRIDVLRVFYGGRDYQAILGG
jgi:toxin ParE1/3/4